ncbi:YafY family protein [Anaeromyxobacter sp. Fw109-5]|uniref:helix-turn-helix transcriptional regulator n=1 Tax=Anaeromyxobacter sp. (strain Fw109-5) TaxID=404589 RepID=UPI0000ED7047|nr:WYL domain-containing protein [Anaeromyxobacter sp. Fw109-5]ABS27931.1 Helix-turn-helix type 11 domain protein [Anaeromyxobacter sp. Fw109-5]
MKSSRLLALLLLLQRRRRATASQLAEELEVCVRTLYRDVAALAAAGVPLWTEPGPQGGIRLMDGWRTRLDGLTVAETTALLLSGAPSALSDLGLAAVAANARAKVDATLPEALRARAAALRDRFHLDAPGWFTRTEPIEALATVAEAVWEGRRLDLRYGEDGARRRVDPLGLVLKAGTWYLVARHRVDLRTYRVGRISGAVLLDARFERPAGFELAAWWGRASAEFDRSLLRYPCTIRLSPAAFRLLPKAVPSEAIRDMLAAAEAPDDEGWRTVALRLEGEEIAAHQLTALGAGVEVVAPQALRARLHAVGRAMAERNATAPGAAGA